MKGAGLMTCSHNSQPQRGSKRPAEPFLTRPWPGTVLSLRLGKNVKQTFQETEMLKVKVYNSVLKYFVHSSWICRAEVLEVGLLRVLCCHIYKWETPYSRGY